MNPSTSRRKFLSAITTVSLLNLAGCSSSQAHTDATVILTNLLSEDQTVVVRIFNSNGEKVWEQQAELPGAPPDEAPAIKTVNALQSVEIGSDFNVEVNVESIEETATGRFLIDCKDDEFFKVRIMKEYDEGKPLIDFRTPSC